MNNAPIVKNDLWNYRFRLFTAAGIIPALIVVLPYPWTQFELTNIPSICCAPLAMSAALGAVTLTGRKTSPALLIFADLIIAASLLVVIVSNWHWIVYYPGLSNDSTFVITPILIDLYIHFRFAILDLPTALYSLVEDRSCPHCKRTISSFPHLVQHAHIEQGQTRDVQPPSVKEDINLVVRE